jgi:hypothetical protein
VNKVIVTLLGLLALASSVYGQQDTFKQREDFSTEVIRPETISKLNGHLYREIIRKDGTVEQLEPLHNLIVNTGEAFLVDAWQGSVTLSDMRYHGIGTGTTAAAEADTACQTELTTQYNPDNTRATGTLTEGATANIFKTVGTNTVDATVAITEFCLMSNATVGSGVMWTHSIFSAVNLVSGDQLRSTYQLTVE